MVGGVRSKLEGSEAGSLEEARSIMSDIIKEVMDKNSDTDKKDVTDRTDSKPLDNLRLANDMLKDDAPTDCLEVSEKENPADDATRSPRTVYSDNWVSNENRNEVFHKAVKVVSDKATDTMKPDRDLNVIENTNMKIADTDKKETIEHIKYYVEKSNESEGEQSEANWPSWRSTPVEDTSRNSNDKFPVDKGEKICSDEIS